MTDANSIQQVLERYVAAFNGRDRDVWVGLFAPDARQEDPVGGPVNVGHEAIGAFFDAMGAMGDIQLSRPRPSIVIGDEALLFLTATTRTSGMVITVPFIVDHIEFDSAGRMTSLRAFWDNDSIETVAE